MLYFQLISLKDSCKQRADLLAKYRGVIVHLQESIVVKWVRYLLWMSMGRPENSKIHFRVFEGYNVLAVVYQPPCSSPLSLLWTVCKANFEFSKSKTVINFVSSMFNDKTGLTHVVLFSYIHLFIHFFSFIRFMYLNHAIWRVNWRLKRIRCFRSGVQ